MFIYLVMLVRSSKMAVAVKPMNLMSCKSNYYNKSYIVMMFYSFEYLIN